MTQASAQDSYDPSAGAHALVDLRFQGTAYKAGDPFPTDIGDAKLRMMHNAHRIGFGKPSRKLVEKAHARRVAEAHLLTGAGVNDDSGDRGPDDELEEGHEGNPLVIKGKGAAAAVAAAAKTPARTYDPKLDPDLELNQGGPTIEEWAAVGYELAKYPPGGWSAVESPGLNAFRNTGKVPAKLVKLAREALDEKAKEESKKKGAAADGDPPASHQE